MFDTTIDQLATLGAERAQQARTQPLSFLVGSAMAGAYVGFGAILMFTVGAHVGPEMAHFMMGAVFALGLTLVIFAGSHLFTGYTLYMALAWMSGRANGGDVLGALACCWFGNLLGAALLGGIFTLSGGGVLLTDGLPLFHTIAAAKANTDAVPLVFRAILCNWLVCLTVWMCARTTSDAAKLGLIFWPIMAFAACGFEHSVANMFTFSLALFGHIEGVTLQGALDNLAWVTLGNTIGGVLMVGVGYWVQSREALAPRATRQPVPQSAPSSEHQLHKP
ncbi:formate/nitrite transporter family protein [Massilia sp.]|uniref:formate/nitrite transporter family protein n=1 Tax=Massilia sp. TaxID=1882437 RepID=UPI00289A2E01|nr:formate/nitrite transporter family protein [Massilia sp.]